MRSQRDDAAEARGWESVSLHATKLGIEIGTNGFDVLKSKKASRLLA